MAKKYNPLLKLGFEEEGSDAGGFIETALTIKEKLETLTNDDRLDAFAIKNLPPFPTILYTSDYFLSPTVNIVANGLTQLFQFQIIDPENNLAVVEERFTSGTVSFQNMNSVSIDIIINVLQCIVRTTIFIEQHKNRLRIKYIDPSTGNLMDALGAGFGYDTWVGMFGYWDTNPYSFDDSKICNLILDSRKPVGTYNNAPEISIHAFADAWLDNFSLYAVLRNYSAHTANNVQVCAHLTIKKVGLNQTDTQPITEDFVLPI